MFNRVLSTSYQWQRRTPNTQRIAKIITMPIARNRSRAPLLPIAPGNRSHKGKHNAAKCWVKRHLPHTAKRQSETSFGGEHHSPEARGLSC